MISRRMDEHLELNAERDVGREGFVDDGEDDHRRDDDAFVERRRDALLAHGPRRLA